jgi:hypothetical protein
VLCVLLVGSLAARSGCHTSCTSGVTTQQALATKLLDQGGVGGRRQLSAVAPLNLTDIATIHSVLATVQSTFADPLQFGQGATNTISSAQLTAAAGGIANVNGLAASSTSVTVRSAFGRQF